MFRYLCVGVLVFLHFIRLPLGRPRLERACRPSAACTARTFGVDRELSAGIDIGMCAAPLPISGDPAILVATVRAVLESNGLMTKLLGISGSLRAKSFNTALLRAAQAAAIGGGP